MTGPSMHASFTLEPWSVRETALVMDRLGETESIFALGNGHLGLRGNLDEGEPYGLPGTYVNSFFEERPLPYAEAGYGYPEAGQTLINVTNGKVLRLLVDDEPFDVRYGTVCSHERVLDLRAGTLTRTVEWESPAGQVIKVRSVRLVSLTQRAIAAISYEVEAVGDEARVVVQSELVANEPLPAPDDDPRVAAALTNPLVSEDFGTRDGTAVELVHRTTASRLRIAAAMDHVVDGPDNTSISAECFEDIGRVTVTALLQPGEKLCMVKFLAYGWSAERSRQALRDQVTAAITAARHTQWEGLLREQHEYLDEFWSRVVIELDGDPEIQQAIRFGLFHVLQAGARAERRCIAAKGLTGTGYDGHAFWDTETFVLPTLTYTFPEVAADALRWRHSTLDKAKQRAGELGLEGAAFPWRTIAGHECSGYWPAGTAAFHVNADVADAVIRYIDATEDEDFETTIGFELLVETARLWRSLGHHDSQGNFRIPGVTGPDEYSAVADDNIYTNLMARRNLHKAADLAFKHRPHADGLGVSTEEAASWRNAADSMFVPYDDDLQVHSQALNFTVNEVWDFDATPRDHYPLLLHYPYFDLYRKQVVKQADLVLAMHLCDDSFTEEQKVRNFEYYEALTVRDSSLSAATQAVIAAELGHLDLAYDYLGEAALVDLDDLHNNTQDGLHMASLASGWTALVCGFGGFRATGGKLSFSPRIPESMRRLAFNLWYRKRRIRVVTTPAETTYLLLQGEPITVSHHGEELRIDIDAPQTRPIPTAPSRAVPRQPTGCEPVHRRALGYS